MLLLVLPGCSATSPAPAASTAPSADSAAQTLLDAVLRSGQARDRVTFDAQLSAADASFAARAGVLYDNLAALPWARLDGRLQPERAPLPDRLGQLLGPGAWRQAATLSWRLKGERGDAEHTVWLTLTVTDGGTRLAGTTAPTDAESPGSTPTPQPLWWAAPVTAASRSGATVLVGAGQPAAAWLDRAARASAVVRERVSAGAAASWDGALVVEVPASRPAFETVLGAEPNSYAGIAAVTLPEGPSGTAALRVVVNPEVTRTLTGVGVAVVLTHETVHVATRSPSSPAPLWIVEGLADHVALAAYPSAADGVAEPLLAQVRAGRTPQRLPADDAFRAGSGQLALSYAEAWTACRFLARGYSPDGLQRLYTALDRGQPLDQAARSVLGVSQAGLVAGWRSALQRDAGG